MSDIRFNQWLHQSGTGGVSQVASGAVGVGTTNPLADFYVRGDAQITGILTAGHIAMGSSITFGDDDRAYFGDGTDLQIYHSGSHSYLKNTTDYTLWIQNNDSQSVIVSNNSGVNKSASFNIGAAAELYHANNKKFETSSTGVSITGQATATGNSAMYRAVESGGATVEIRCGGAEGYVGTSSNHKVSLITNGNRRWEISGAGHFIPYANDTYDIGSSSYRVRDIYTGDLNLSNVAKKDKGGNDVDGTWGDFTIQEGESDLFLINNRSGKKYKFNLTEVS